MIEPLLLAAAASRPAVVLTGARQTGKTTLVRSLFPNHTYVSLDLPATARLAEESPATFLAQYPAPLVIDEVQYAPALFRHLKLAIDEKREAVGQFILTGSQPFALMQGVGDSLAGRVSVLTLEGLSWAEARQAMPDASIEELIWRGGFPELYVNPSIDVHRFYADYVATYLERDLRNLLQVNSLRDFDRFMRACAGRTAGLLNMNNLGRDCGITGPTAKSWLSMLERSGQVQLLEPWFSNKVKGLTKSPKLHLNDSGMACFLTAHRSVNDLRESPLIGNIWESAVVGEIRKAQLNEFGHCDMQYFRNRGHEADILLHRAGRILCADAKWTENPGDKERKQIDKVLRLIDQAERGAILCRSAHSYPLSETIQAIVPNDIFKLATSSLYAL